MKRKTKRKIIECIQGVLVLSVLIGIYSISSYIEHNYTREAKVIEISQDNEIIVEDKVGNIWSFYEEEKTLAVGDNLKLKMNDNCTSNNIYDDIITGYKNIN